MPFAIDVSNHSGDLKGKGPALRDHARRIIIGTQDVAVAKAQVDEVKNCFDIHLYQFHYLSIPIQRELDKTLEVHQYVFDKTGKSPFVWMDFEDKFRDHYNPPLLGYEVHPDVITGWVQYAIFLAEEEFGSVGLYTRRGWWQEYTADNSGLFTNLPLWAADWDGVPDLNVYKPFGGWSKQTMKQYAGDVTVEGVLCDLNVY